MALYDGFFDATYNEETEEYDRAYGSGDFTGYFANLIGSGVCIHDNPDSFKAEYEDGTLYLRPGYLFIKGYWLANKAGDGETASTYKGYAVTLPTGMTGSMAVVAHLNLGQRMIEIEVQPVSQAYPDSLVLAIITTTTADDTRHNTDICGVIDTAGALSIQVEWALNYIDTEIESKLAQVEQDIAAQDAKLTAKIAEVQAVADSIVPPPIGSIKFSASQNVGDDWLQCDGSFINQSDYPELVEALGKLEPGAESFTEIFGGSVGAGLSNGYLYDGTYWVYSAGDQTLHGYKHSTARFLDVTVTGAESLTVSSANPISLSIVSGHLFLAQNQTSANSFLLLECINFANSVTSIQVNALDVATVIQNFKNSDSNYKNLKIPGINFSPEIVTIEYNFGTSSSPDVQEAFAMCLGRGSLYVTGSDYLWCIFSLIWKQSSFPSAKIIIAFTSSMRQQPSIPYSKYIDTLFRYSRKNSGELVNLDVVSTSSVTSDLGFQLSSEPDGTYETISTGYAEATSSGPDSIRTSPVVGNARYIYRAYVSAGKLYVRAGKYNPNVPYTPNNVTVAAPSLPSRANVFPDSICYAANQDLWFVFVGTGIAFSQSPEVGSSWGYLDTQDVLGTITQFGCIEYNPDENLLYISGQDTVNAGKLGVMQLPELYNYANDGAWLPMIAADGIPAYIKAKGDEGGGSGDITDPVQMQITVAIEGYFAEGGSVLFNNGVLIAGTFSKTVSSSGTFTVGIRKNGTARNMNLKLSMNGTQVALISYNSQIGTESSATFNVSDFITNGITLTGTTST